MTKAVTVPLVVSVPVYEDDAILRRLAVIESRLDAIETSQPVDPDPLPVDPDPLPVDPDPLPVGTLINYPLASDAEIDSLHFVAGMEYPATDPRAGSYDETLGGAKMKIIPGERMSSIRLDKAKVEAPTDGVVEVTWEVYFPQSFFDLPWKDGTMKWTSIKTFRGYNLSKRETKRDESFTCTISPVARPQVWIRSAGDFKQHVLPNGKMSDINELRADGFYLQPDRWYQFTVVKDYQNKTLTFKAIDVSTSNVEINKTMDMEYLTPLDNIAALLHSTSRQHNDQGAGDPHATFVGYRSLRMLAR